MHYFRLLLLLLVASGISSGIAYLIVPKNAGDSAPVQPSTAPQEPSETIREVEVAQPQSEDSPAPEQADLYVTGIGARSGRINVSLSDGTHRTEKDGTILNWDRNFVEFSDLGILWVKARPFSRNSSDQQPDPEDSIGSVEMVTNDGYQRQRKPNFEPVTVLPVDVL